MDGSGKKCSIVFIGDGSSSQVNSCLRALPVERLSVDYELLFIIAHPTQTDSTYQSTKMPIKFVEPEGGLGFEQLCMEATRQASGEYIIFVNSPISYEQVVEAIYQLEFSGMDIEAPKEKKYIIVKKAAFTRNQGFLGLSQEQRKQNEHWAINQLIHLVIASASSVSEVLFSANKNRLLFENIIKHIDLTKKDDCNIYKLIFLKSIKGYLDSGLEFNSEQQCIDFYRKATLPTSPCMQSQAPKGITQVQVRQVPEIPWFVGIILSLPHLNDSHNSARHTPKDLQQSVAILVSVYNETRFTRLCFEAVRKFTKFPYHLMAINNSTIDMQHFKMSVFKKGLIDEWFDTGSTSHSEGLQKSLAGIKTFRYITTLDSDAIVLKKAWLTEFIEQMNREKAALIGPQTSPGSNPSIKGYAIHPCCMVIDKERIGSRFKINFTGKWPFDVGLLLTWDCLAHGIPIVKVSHEMDGNYATGSSLINKSVRHYWYASRISGLEDNAFIDGCKVGKIREKLNRAYRSAKLSQIQGTY